MKSYKKIATLVFGATLMFGAGTIVANAQNNDRYYRQSNMGYTKLSSQNDNFSGSFNENESFNEKDYNYFKEMYDYCHGNRGRNQNSKGGMMNNYYDNEMMNY